MSLKSGVSTRWAAAKARYSGLQHVVDAWNRLQDNNGGQYAAAITYFSFLALFPLILLGVAITGFVLHAHPAAQASLLKHISDNIPGSFGTTVQSSINTAIKQRTGVGLIGLAGVLLTGLGWVANLRAAIDAMWGRTAVKQNFLKARVSNLMILIGLGGAILVSLALTVVGTSLTDQIVRAIGLDDVTGMHVLLKLIGIGLAGLGDIAIFWWLIARLPHVDVPRRLAVRGSVLAAVGFEVLKIVGTVTIAHTARSPTAGPFAGVIAILVWIQLVARFQLFSVAWVATAMPARSATLTPVPTEVAEPISLTVSD